MSGQQLVVFLHFGIFWPNPSRRRRLTSLTLRALVPSGSGQLARATPLPNSATRMKSRSLFIRLSEPIAPIPFVVACGCSVTEGMPRHKDSRSLPHARRAPRLMDSRLVTWTSAPVHTHRFARIGDSRKDRARRKNQVRRGENIHNIEGREIAPAGFVVLSSTTPVCKDSTQDSRARVSYASNTLRVKTMVLATTDAREELQSFPVGFPEAQCECLQRPSRGNC